MAEPTRSQRIRQASAERRARRRQELRRAILDAATQLFLEHGFEQFSLRQVAEAIGYSPTTIYHHFADKDELLFTVAMEGMQRFGEDLQAGYQSADEPLARLSAIGRAYIRFGLEHPLHYRLMFMQRGEWLEREPPEGCESVIDSFGILETTVAECLAAGAIASPPDDPRALAFRIWAHVHGLVALVISTPYLPAEQLPPMTEAHLQLMIDGLRPRDGQPNGRPAPPPAA